MAPYPTNRSCARATMLAHGPDSEPSTRDLSSGRGRPVSQTPPGTDTLGRSPLTVPDATDPALSLWPALGDYELLHVAGEGGMGVVFQARHRPTGQVVALKTMKPAAALSS